MSSETLILNVVTDSEVSENQQEEFFEKGNIDFLRGDYDQAINAYNKHLNLKPTHHIAYINRGNAYRQLGFLEEADRSYSKALTLNPEHAPAYYNRASVRRGLHRYKEAMADYDTAIELCVHYVEAYINRGNLRIFLGDYNEAIADYSKAILIGSNHDAAAYYNRGLCLAQLNRKEEAEVDFCFSRQLLNKSSN